MEDEHEPASKRRKVTNEDGLREAEGINLEETERKVKLKQNSAEDCKDLPEDVTKDCLNDSSRVRAAIETSPKAATLMDNSQEELVKDDQERLTEHDVGIIEYISTLQGIPGVLKQRYSDFVVWEIDTDGEIVKLDRIGEKIVEGSKDDETRRREPENEEKGCPLSEGEVAQLNAFVLNPTEEDPNKNNLMLNGSKDKETRKQMHFYIKKNYAILGM